MKRASSSRRGRAAARTEARRKKCPYCTELLSPQVIHICPAGCCYVPADGESREVVCPYCELVFDTGARHVCLELIKLTEPAQ